MNVADFNGYDGFSFKRLTKWVGRAATGIAKGDYSALAEAIPGAPAARHQAPLAPLAPPKPPGAFAPGGFVEKNQTVLLIAAAGFAALLFLKPRR